MFNKRCFRHLVFLIVLVSSLLTPATAYGARASIQLQTSPQIFTDMFGTDWFTEDLYAIVYAVDDDLEDVVVEFEIKHVGQAFHTWLDAMETFSTAGSLMEVGLGDPTITDIFELHDEARLDSSLFNVGHAYVNAVGYRDHLVFETQLEEPIPAGEGRIVPLYLTQFGPEDLGCDDSCSFIPEGIEVRVNARNANRQSIYVDTTILESVPEVQRASPIAGELLGPYPLLQWSFTHGISIEAIQIQVERAGAYNPYHRNRDWILNDNGDYDIFARTAEPGLETRNGLSRGRYMWWISTALSTDIWGKPEDIIYHGPFYFTVSPDCDPGQSATRCIQPEQAVNTPLGFGYLVDGLLSADRTQDTWVVNASANQVVWIEHQISEGDLDYSVEFLSPSETTVPAYLIAGSMTAYLPTESGPHTIRISRVSGRGYYEIIANQAPIAAENQPVAGSLGPEIGSGHYFVMLPDPSTYAAVIVHAEQTDTSLRSNLEILGTTGNLISRANIDSPGEASGGSVFETSDPGPYIVHGTYRGGEADTVTTVWQGITRNVMAITPNAAPISGWLGVGLFADLYTFTPVIGEQYTVVVDHGDSGSLSATEVLVLGTESAQEVASQYISGESGTLSFEVSDDEPLEINIVARRGVGTYQIALESLATNDPGGAPAPTVPSTCVPATIALWAAERAPGGSGHKWQYVYRVSGATHVRFYDNVLPVDSDGRAVGTFAIWDDGYVPVGTLSAYNGSEECRVEATLPGFDPRNLPPAGTYSGQGFEDVDVSQRSIVISMRDYASIDGDRVRLVINSAVVANDVTLTGDWHDVRVNLQPGANTVVLIALNEGSESPNTVEIHISHVISGLPDQVSRGMSTNQSDSFVIRAP